MGSEDSERGPVVPEGPPRDAEEWSDEQWLEWLEATDAEGAEARAAAPGPRARRRGGVLGAAMLGLRDAIYGRPDEEVVIVSESPGGPPDDELPKVMLDPEHPERSTVVVRRSDGPRRPPGPGGRPDSGD